MKFISVIVAKSNFILEKYLFPWFKKKKMHLFQTCKQKFAKDITNFCLALHLYQDSSEFPKLLPN